MEDEHSPYLPRAERREESDRALERIQHLKEAIEALDVSLHKTRITEDPVRAKAERTLESIERELEYLTQVFTGTSYRGPF